MSSDAIKEAYNRIVEEHQSKDAAPPAFKDNEQRIHPRLKVKSKDLWISTIPEFALVDMSASGLAILSNHPVRRGEMIHISLGDSLAVDAEVVDCWLQESPTEYTDGEFRIQCKFLEDMMGMELIVKALSNN